MDPELWKKVEDLFDAALDRAPSERQSFLIEACAGDDALRRQVETLIRSYEAAGTFIEDPVLEPKVELERTTDPSFSLLGKRIGAYRLTREIGRGGMGAVYLSVRADDEFQKRVAIKLVKRGMDTDFILRRFRQERQILASLDHQYIARLLDGGTTEDGLPYFVMEYIEGLPITTFCDTQRLSTIARLRLFLKVCAAVQHAHQNLVIHRDLKPSNVLVTSDSTPKLLDFGIAKLLNPEMGAQTLDPTTLAMRLMTPEYASPEQVRGESVTSTSDIYSLGVLLYELLTGHRPYRLKTHTTEELARLICDVEPQRPSEVIDLIELVPSKGLEPLEISPGSVVAAREASLEELRRKLSGNLDNLVLKALCKEAHLRYQSAEALAEDIERYIDGMPVLAQPYLPASALPKGDIQGPQTGPKSIAVLAFKTIRSDETTDEYFGMGMADALITKLSNIRRIIVRPTSSILKYFEGDYTAVFAGNELSVDYVLDGRVQRIAGRVRVTVQLIRVRDGAPLWAEKFDEKFTDIFTVEDSISEKVAQALMPQLSGEEMSLLRKRDTDDPEAYQCYLQGRFFWNKFTEDGLTRALELFKQAIRLDPEYALAYAGLADYLNWAAIFSIGAPRDYFPQAKAAALRALELDDSLAEAHSALAFTTLCFDWDVPSSERRFKKALELNPRYGPAHQWYSMLLTAKGQFDEALAAVRRAEELNPLSLMDRSMAGWTFYQARQYDRAVRELERALELDRNFGHSTMNLGSVLERVGEHDRAIQLLTRSLDLLDGSMLPLWMLGYTLASAGRRNEAMEIVNRLRRLSGELYVSPYSIAMIYVGLDETDLAFEWFENAFQNRDEWLIWLGTEPKLDKLRSDPRYASLLQRIGIVDPALISAEAVGLPVTTNEYTATEHPLPSVHEAIDITELFTPKQHLAVVERESEVVPVHVAARSDRTIIRSTAYIAVAMIFVAMLTVGIYRRNPGPAHPGFLTNVKTVKLTANGTATSATVSPDGNFIAYTAEEGGKQSLWVRQVSATNNIRLVPSAEVQYRGSAFSKDGSQIYYVSRSKTGGGALYKISSQGGQSSKILDNVDSGPGISNDGRSIAFVRSDTEHGEDMLMVSNADGSGERRIASRSFPRHFSVTSAPAWSPHGDMVSVVVENSDNFGFFMSIANVQTTNGSEVTLGSERWLRIGQTTWLGDGSGVVMSAQNGNSSFEQLYLLSYPDGVSRKLTTDPSDYDWASLPAASDRLVAIQTQTLTNVWLAQKNALEKAVQLTPGVGRYFDISWAPDGKIVYSSDSNGSADIWEMDADGSGQRQVTSSVGRNYAPAVSPDGKYIVYHSNRSGTWQVWRMNRDGNNQVQLSTGEDSSNWPQVTRDGQWVIYEHVGGGSLASIWKTPIDGGNPVRLSKELSMRPAISPDGHQLAYWQKDQTPGAKWRIVLIRLDGDPQSRNFDTLQSPTNGNTNLRWSTDGKAVIYMDYREGTTSFWSQPIDGSAASKVTEVANNQIYAFDIFKDGRYIFSRGLHTNDVVLMTNAGQ